MGSTSFLFVVALVVLSTLLPAQAEHFADIIPSLGETKEMALLSRLVYKFRSDQNFTCENFAEHLDDDTKYIDCHWYFHDDYLGTQVLIVSNVEEEYVAIVYAGTDDLKTSLEDANIFTKPFGNNETVKVDDKAIRVHAGFNNAVFSHNIWEQVYDKTKALWKEKSQASQGFQLYTTGHSLGAANAMLTAAAFALLDGDFPPVKSITFGAPQIGNSNWRTYFNSSSPLRDRLSICRVVLAWDLVARLPEFFYHVGHTLQIDGKTDEVRVYYEHYGDESRGYAGAPLGWYSRAAWVPFALNYHRMHKYFEHIQHHNHTTWARRFFPTDGTIYDDDIWDNPPDDWIQPEAVEEELSIYEQIKRLLV